MMSSGDDLSHPNMSYTSKAQQGSLNGHGDISMIYTLSSNSNQTYESGVNQCCACWEVKDNNQYSRHLNTDKRYACRFKFCCGCTCCISALLIFLILAILRLAYIPNAMQHSIDHIQFIQSYISLSKATNNSIILNTTLTIVNCGPYDSIIDPTVTTLLYQGNYIGTLNQPEINIKSIDGAIVSLYNKINIDTQDGVILFRKMLTQVLSGKDCIISLESSPKFEMKLFGLNGPSIAIEKVNMNKHLVIISSMIESANIKNLSISITDLNGFGDIEFSISSSLHLFIGKSIMNLYDTYNNQLGIGVIPLLNIKPGYNKLSNVSIILKICEHCSNISESNLDAIQQFIGNYEGGYNQILNLRGPTGESVASNILNFNAFVYGNCHSRQ